MTFRSFPAILAVLASGVAPVSAARTKLPEQYDKWLKQEVVYIITDEERKAFLQLASDKERDRFIEDFWDVRNPQRGSDHNPYKEGIYQRIEYANEHFGRMTNTPGWMTDMGRAYIELGKPISMHEFIGNGQIYPLALWSYANNTGDPALPPFFNLLFFQAEDIEEYRFYRPWLDGPLKLVRGSNFNSNGDVYRALMAMGGDVAHAAFSLVPNEPVDTVNYQPEMSSDMLVSKIQNLKNDTFNVRRLREMRALRERVQSYMLVAQDRPLPVDSLVLTDPAGQYWLDYAVGVENPAMGTPANDTDLNVRVDYHLTTPDGGLIVEDSEERAYPAFDIGPNGKTFLPFEVANRLPLVPGEYKLEVDIVNAKAGTSWKGVRTISAGPPKDLTLRGPLLAASVAKAAQPDGFTPFEYYGAEFHPSAQGNFSTSNPLTVLYELEQPPAGAGDYVVDYVLANVSDREQRHTLMDKIAATDFRDGRLLKSKTMPLTGLWTGEYRLVLNVRRTEGGAVLATANLPLTIANDRPSPALFISANSRNMGRAGVGAYIRGLEAVAQKDEAGAARYLHQAIDQNPGNGFAGDYLVQIWFRQRNYNGVADLYRKLGMAPFKASPQAMAAITLSILETGQKAEAKKVLAMARSYLPDDPVLKSAAKAVDKAR